MTKVCRLCLLKLQRGSRYFNINAVESSTGFMPYRDQLTTCIPEMALDLIPNPVICNNCRNTLKSAYEFKSRCLKTEKKIREYVEKQPANCTTYNLAEIDSFSRLAKPVKVDRLEIKLIGNSPKFLPILPKVTKKDTNHQQSTSSILSNLLSVQEELRLPNRSEIEITNVNVEVSKGKRIRAIQTEVQTLAQTAPEISFTPLMPKDEHGLFTCNHCDKKFPNIPLLHSHKTKIHEEDYLCNFCNSPFKTLQSLRKHNQQCQKSNVASTIQNVITKRPHLPTKAKNHLKRWLFDHTDHPYPTDMEKQQLMKETNLSLLQVENWFINARRRILADLTRLKNMSGNFPKGRGRGRANRRARGKLDFVLDDFLLYEDVSAEESAAAVKTAVACNRTNTVVALPAPMKQENVDKNDNREEDIEDIKPQFRIPIEIATVKEDDRFFENVDMDAEDPLEKDIPLNLLTKDVKMEVDLDR